MRSTLGQSAPTSYLSGRSDLAAQLRGYSDEWIGVDARCFYTEPVLLGQGRFAPSIAERERAKRRVKTNRGSPALNFDFGEPKGRGWAHGKPTTDRD